MVNVAALIYKATSVQSGRPHFIGTHTVIFATGLAGMFSCWWQSRTNDLSLRSEQHVDVLVILQVSCACTTERIYSNRLMPENKHPFREGYWWYLEPTPKCLERQRVQRRFPTKCLLPTSSSHISGLTVSLCLGPVPQEMLKSVTELNSTFSLHALHKAQSSPVARGWS